MNTLQTKKVSVIVPNYNYAKYVGKRIETVLKQTYPIYELIILDDASTDGSLEEIRRVLKKHQLSFTEEKEGDEKKEDATGNGLKVRLIVNQKNSGKAILQWRKGFSEATGDFIWIAEADDLCSRRFLEKVMEGLSEPETVLSYTESEIINASGLVIAPNFRWSRDKEKTGHYKASYIKNGFREIEEIMAIRCTIPNVSAVVFRKTSRIPYLKYLDEAAKFSQVGDWYFYVRVLTYGNISYCKKALNKFRVHKNSKTAGSKKEDEHFREILWMHRILATKFNLNEFVTRRVVAEEERVAKKMRIDKERIERLRREVAEMGF